MSQEPLLSDYLILDGGLATQLEKRGHDLSDSLWSARLLRDAPDEIQAVNREYLEAGADVITTASYQATVSGFMSHGLNEQEAIELIQRSVQLARTARDEFWNCPSNRPGRQRPLVAASVGSYGAFLANGAEYTGEYDLDEAGLMDFHRQRWFILAQQNPDLMLCETIPSLVEARVLSQLAAESQLPTWISFSCRDTSHIGDGTPLRQCAMFAQRTSAVSAIGVNCLSPHWVAEIVQNLRGFTDKPILVYPNSGEIWQDKQWVGESLLDQFTELAKSWRESGASIIGGCCRTTPAHIRGLRT